MSEEGFIERKIRVDELTPVFEKFRELKDNTEYLSTRLGERLDHLERRFASHSSREEESWNVIIRDVAKMVGQLEEVVNTLRLLAEGYPRDEAGKLAPHIHLEDHEELLTARQTRDRRREKISAIATEWAVKIGLGLAVISVLGEKGQHLIGLLIK